MSHTRRLALSTLLTLLVLGSTLLVQHFSSAQAMWLAQAGPAPTPHPPAVATPAAAPNAPATTITVNSTADGAPANDGQCTLREALLNANGDNQSGSTDCVAGSGADVISFSALFNTPQTIVLTNGEMGINQGVTITGPGAHLLTVSGNNTSRIFRVGGGVTGVAISGMTISNGKAGDVGGGMVSDGDLALTNCALVNNAAGSGWGGGGVYQAGGIGTFTGCTFSGNTAASAGGVQVINSNATLTNCTISGNTATSFGGGLTLDTIGGGAAKTLTVTNCTIANNTSPGTGGLQVNSGGGVNATATLKNSIIANNGTPNLATTGGATAIITSQGFNLSDNGNGFLNQGTDITAPPLLGPLQNNGGTTSTHALLPGSPAINAGTNAGAPATDQRGVSRPQGAAVDIGAFEVAANPLVVTNTNDAGTGSLRQAITDANASAGADTITFSALFNTAQTITLTTGELAITSNLTINSPGANLLTVSGNNASRVFSITSNSNAIVSISGMTISGGNVVPINGFGGGIFNGTTNTLTVTNSTISGNSAFNGGGIRNNSGTLTVTNSTISGNTATRLDTTGGGIDNIGTLTLTNSTISGNSAPNGTFNMGGGIFTSGANATITNCTITNNSTTGAVSASGVFRSGGTVTIRNTIIAGNVSNSTVPDVSGAFDAASAFNLIGNVGTATGFTPANQNQTGNGTTQINPLLGPLTLNGGTTPTHALLPGSPALDKGSLVAGVTTDQRGLPRPVNITSIPMASGGNESDIGAFEFQGQLLTVTKTADTNDGVCDADCSLREAIAAAAAGDGIAFAALFNTPQTIALALNQLSINKNLTINAPGAHLLTVSGNQQAFRVFSINGNFSVSLSGMTITGGSGLGFAAGGGIFNDGGTLTVTNATISGNTASEGGGIDNNGGTLTVSNSTISGNTATGGGGGINNLGTLTVTNSTISGNSVTNTFGSNNCGGISTSSTTTITNSTITNNSAAGAASASGVFRNSGTVTIRNSIIAGNVNNATQPDVSGAFDPTSAFNLIGNVGTATGFTPANQNQTGNGTMPINPLLGSLANNGGTTPTHALLGGSPALDKGHRSGSTTDQRGLIRPFDITTIPFATGGDNADIGAFETQALIVTNADNMGAGSLREALTDANVNADVNDILFDTMFFNVARIINLASALPNLTTRMNINGPGANLLTVRRDTGGDYRIFTVNVGQTVSLSNLTISNGKTPSGQSGGGILNFGTLSLANCIVSGNTATAAFGGGIGSSSSLTINNSLISGNNANNGGGVAVGGGTLTMLNSTVSGNTAVFQSGGLSIFPATATLTNCTISGNTAGTLPGAILNATDTGQTSALTLTNCTVTGNVSTTSGIGNIVTNNSGVSATTQLKNTLVAGNTGPNFSTFNATLTSLGNNLDSDGSSGFTNGVNGNIVGTAGAPINAWLGLLADNGGPTPTHALLLGSPALDKGSLAAGVTTDQRGLMRPFDIGSILPASNGNDSDIGAFEAQSLPLPGIFINDVALAEGNAGTSTATFNVTLSAASAQTVTVQYATANGTATAGSDYVATSGMLTFNPGVTSQPVNVTINGDTVLEPGETFFVNLTSPTNAVLVDPQGRGLIINDETYIVTNANDAGAGSLRQALLDANTNSSGAQTILFEPVFFSTARTINLASALPDITSSVTITGPGANLLTVRRDTGGNYRIFTINSGVIVTLSGLTMTNGNANAGCILNNGTLTASNCAITGNTTDNGGGGLWNEGTLTMTGCTINGNSSTGGGSGGLVNVSFLRPATATLTNCTISGNTAVTGSQHGGGIDNDSYGFDATLSLINCTIANNTVNDDTNAGGLYSAKFGTGNANITLKNTLVAGNSNPQVRQDVGGTVTSLGNNLLSDNSLTAAAGDLLNTNPLLAALGNNGGPTQTHALNPGSPAINAGTNTGAPATDQRGVTRPQGAAVDIGAFELLSNPLVVTNTNDAGAGSLRQALLDANTSAGADTVSFSALFNAPQTITLTTGELAITSSLTINGTDASLLTVSGNNASRVFSIVSGFTVSLSGMKITGGTGVGVAPSGTGGGITNNGSALMVTDSTISGNTASGFGGGLSNGGTLTLTNSTISGNTATGGGGGMLNLGTLTLTNSTISGNTANGTGTGGGLENRGILTINNSTISGNSTPNGNNNGGGLWSGGGAPTTTITNSTITNNTAAGANSGAGLLRNAGTVTMVNSLIAGNVNNTSLSDVFAVGDTGITSNGFNLIGNRGTLTFNATGDQSGTGAAPLNPVIGALANNGGPTSTHALLPGSSAINAGTNTGAPATDQRGITRPQPNPGATTDIGAYESRGFTLAVTSGSGQSALINTAFAAPLVATVSSANSEPVQGGRVTFTPPGAGASAVLTGSPAAIAANGQASVTALANGLGGSYNVAANANGAATAVNFNLTNTVCPAITVNPTNPTLPNGRAGTAYNQTFTQTGGVGTVTWSVSAGSLPTGLTLTGAVLSGTPTVNGSFGFTIKATDTNGCMGTQAYTLLLNPPCTAITVNPATLPNGFQGTAYAQTLTATGGTAPYTFAVTTGSLPGGLTLAGGGALTGTPTTPGTFSFTVTATDNTGCTGLRAYTVIVSGNGLMFYPLPRPIRLLDTRAGEGNCDSVGTPIVGGTSITTQARITCEGITLPPSAQAVVGNVTVINLSAQAGFMTLYPNGVTAPLAANMVYQPGQVLSNAFTVGLGATGAFDIFGQRTIDVVVDISGYYAPPGAANPGGLYFHPLSRPVRLLDTRAGEGNCDSVGTPIAAGASLTTQARISCEGLTIPPAAQAVVGNATVINLTNQAGFLTLYPNGVSVPLAANMVYQPGQVLSNAFTVSLNASGEFNIFGQRTIEMVVDVAGYYSSEASDTNGPGLLFSALPRPVRLLDTRAGEGNCDSVGTPIAAGTSLTTQARITCEGIPIPSTAQTVLGNVTVINLSNQAGFLTMYPNGVTAPLAANLVYQPSQILANAFVVGLSGGGEFNIFGQRMIEAIVDVSGYFAP